MAPEISAGVMIANISLEADEHDGIGTPATPSRRWSSVSALQADELERVAEPARRRRSSPKATE